MANWTLDQIETQVARGGVNRQQLVAKIANLHLVVEHILDLAADDVLPRETACQKIATVCQQTLHGKDHG